MLFLHYWYLYLRLVCFCSITRFFRIKRENLHWTSLSFFPLSSLTSITRKYNKKIIIIIIIMAAIAEALVLNASDITETVVSNMTSILSSSDEPIKVLPAPPLLKQIHDYLIVVLLVTVMFAMGCSITWKQVWSHVRRPVGVVTGMISQWVFFLFLDAFDHLFFLLKSVTYTSPPKTLSLVYYASLCGSLFVTNFPVGSIFLVLHDAWHESVHEFKTRKEGDEGRKKKKCNSE